MSESKAREFWLRNKTHLTEVFIEPVENYTYHVIEFSAHRAALELIERLEKDIAVANSYYGNPETYCARNCEPDVNYHEPECGILKMFVVALADIKKFREGL